MFLRDAWYVAEISARVGARPAAVRVLDEPIVLYRQRNGVAVALEDACPHRRLPLSMGGLRGDQIECGYHGMTFDASGACVRVPGDQPIPATARVRAYPVIDRYGLLWIWMGTADRADPTTIFNVERWDDPACGRTAPDDMTIACNYLYITDNLLDPSHVAWVHPSSFGDANCMETSLTTVATPLGMLVSRWILDTEVAPFYAQFVKFIGKADRLQHYEVSFPSNALTKAVFTPAGSGGPGSELHPDAFSMDSYGLITPVDAGTSRHFFFQLRNFAPHDAAVSAAFAASVRAAFAEDKVVLEAVQRGMASQRSPNLDLRIDKGPSRFRRRLRQLIEAERDLAGE
jgi:phenylpropionate dioxygenase-like ring-hydroxylating dioxygenase large terminal subunit